MATQGAGQVVMIETATTNDAGTELLESDLETVSGGSNWLPQPFHRISLPTASQQHPALQGNTSIANVQQMVNQQPIQSQAKQIGQAGTAFDQQQEQQAAQYQSQFVQHQTQALSQLEGTVKGAQSASNAAVASLR